MAYVPWTTAMEDALHAWIVAGSGLPAASVFWADQNEPRPAAPCISMRLSASAAPGLDWIDVLDAPDPVDGAEVEEHVRGPRVVTLSLQSYAASATGAGAAGSLLEGVRVASRQTSPRILLGRAGWGVGTVGPIQVIGGAAMNTVVFEPRATLQVTLHAASDAYETATYIESVDVEGSTT